MPEITPEELREPIVRPDIDVFHRLRKKLDSAAATIERLRVEKDGYASGFDTQHAEIERLQARIAELEQQVAALREKNRKMEIIVRERTHRKIGCLCERCLEHEFQVAELVAALRADAERYAFLLEILSFELGVTETTKEDQFLAWWYVQSTAEHFVTDSTTPPGSLSVAIDAARDAKPKENGNAN